MKRILLSILASFVLAAVPVVTTSCSTPPSERVVVGRTLEVVGQSAEATVKLAGQLYQGGTISAAQLISITTFYDGSFQPAFRIAVTAVHGDLSSVASPDVAKLADQLLALLNSYKKPVAK